MDHVFVNLVIMPVLEMSVFAGVVMRQVKLETAIVLHHIVGDQDLL